MSAAPTKVYNPEARVTRMAFTEAPLDGKQKRLWEETRTAMLWHAPMFSHIFYTMMNPASSEQVACFTKDIPIAATDGTQLMLNPDTFFNYTLNERIFICCHEIAHCIFDHCGMLHLFKKRGKITYNDGTELPYIPEAMNVATDLVINDMLIDSKVGRYNKDWLHDTAVGTYEESVIDVYKKLFKPSPGGGGKGNPNKPCNGGQGSAGQGPSLPGGQQFDQHLDPGTSQGKGPDQAQGDRDQGHWQTEVAAAVASAKAQGKMPASMERLFNEVLFPKVDWKDQIRSLFARKVGTGGYDWRRLDRRLIVRGIGAPGKIGYGCDTVVVGVDTSGSISGPILDAFFAEMSGILEECVPERLVVIWCDAKVHRVDELEDSSDLMTTRAKGAPGGGGTAFEPVFERVRELGLSPDALVYLTDGYGSFPTEKPRYPVIWGSITPNGTVKYPFGDVVEIPV